MAFVEDEPSAGTVEETMQSGGALVSWINLGECYYSLARRYGDSRAATAVEGLVAAITAEEPDRELILQAARIKAAHSLSYADCFAVATAERHRLALLTGDPEIVTLDRPLQVIDLRR